jgi:hypothetical protein
MYPHLANAPVDHSSEEFLEYLRTNNVVVYEDGAWLVIENCKYHTPEKPWYTAFKKRDFYTWPEVEMLWVRYPDMDITIKHPNNRSVKRPHVHFHK